MADTGRIIVWLIAALLFSASQAHAAQPLAGKWVNVDETTDSITRLEVREEADGWVIQAWGRCHPVDCDWGAVPLHMAVGDPEARGKPLDSAKLKYGVAYWDSKDLDIRTFTVLHVEDGQLSAESVDVYGAKSGHTMNLRTKDVFKKAQ